MILSLVAIDLPAGEEPGVEVISKAELKRHPVWRRGFASLRKDDRYYELLEDTIRQGFDYRYLAIRDRQGEVRAIQPLFLLDQNMLAGAGAIDRAAGSIRKFWPGFLHMKTLMVGCAAGEGHIFVPEGPFDPLPILARRLPEVARELGARLIVLKEFPAAYRKRFEVFRDAGFHRIPSMPMTRLDLPYADFEDYIVKALSGGARRKIRLKLRAADGAMPIEMGVVRDITPFIEEAYPLYRQVLDRAEMSFEILTEEFFRALGQRMPDKARFFLWRQDNKLVAFALCLVQGGDLFAEYIGLDYSVAIDLHLYHYITRDMINWAIANGYTTFRSSALNYDPKLHLRHVLDPIDLYVRHTNPVFNRALKFFLPLMVPTRNDETLPKFPNYDELWGDDPHR